MDKQKKVIVRGAPSPTSKYGLHVGNLRTLLYNYLFAKQNNGIFYIRIEDTDRERFEPNAENLIKKSLDWIGMKPDYSPWNPKNDIKYRQSERNYDKYIKYLLDNDLAYYAFDTKEELDKARLENKYFAYNHATRMNMRNSLSLSKDETNELIKSNDYVVRFKVQPNRIVSFDDMIRGKVTFNTNDVDDKILLKSDKVGSYHLCNICDDHDMGTTHVIRGEEWLPSAPLHILIYEAFGWDIPKFAHLPLIFNPPGHKGKLSKRKSLNLGFPIFPFGGQEIDDDGNLINLPGFVDSGYEPEALVNFISLLGWAPGGNVSELMSMDELIEKFSFDRVNKAGAKFDIEKLNWFNSQYVNKLKVSDIFSEKDIDKYGYNKLDEILKLAKERAVFRKDLYPIINIFLKDVDNYSDITQINDEYKDTFKDFIIKISDSKFKFSEGKKIKDLIYNISKDKNYKFNKIMPGLRQALTGGISGPDLMTTMMILGKKETIRRLYKSI